MDKIKILILMISVLLLSGCSVNYEITFNKDNVDENLTVLDLNSTYKNSDLEKEIQKIISYNKDETNIYSYYNMSTVIGSVESGILFNYSYDYDLFSKNSVILKTCYDLVNFTNLNSIYTLETSDKYKCVFYTNEPVVITIITDYKVTYNNAATVEDNKYSWIIDPTKSSNKIEFSFLKKEKEDVAPLLGNDDKLQFLIIILGGFFIGIVVYYLYIRVSHKRNKI